MLTLLWKSGVNNKGTKALPNGFNFILGLEQVSASLLILFQLPQVLKSRLQIQLGV
jgi:hypothetical protein